METREHQQAIALLDPLRGLPFVRGLAINRQELGPYHPGAVVTVKTPRRGFKLGLEVKRTFLDRTLTNAIIAEHLALEREHGIPLLLAARYVPRPTGERLAEAGVNFVDRVGNVHLKLGDAYHVLLLGRKERQILPAGRRPGHALVQMIFILLVEPAAAGWPIRKLAIAAGVGKTMAAVGRQRLLQDGVLRRAEGGAYRVTDLEKLGQNFVLAYGQVLRPHLLLGTFRPPDADPELFLKKVAAEVDRQRLFWAITGGPGAHAIDRFYRGEELPLFVEELRPDLQRELRLVPDRHGPVVILRAFCKQVVWQPIGDMMVAHPWLLYAELLHNGQPRALEAAQLIREKYLQDNNV